MNHKDLFLSILEDNCNKRITAIEDKFSGRGDIAKDLCINMIARDYPMLNNNLTKP
jgi:hypothetical protein